MNQPDPSEYEIQDPKGVRPQDPSTIEDPYSIEDARMDRSKPGSWSTRAIAVMLSVLIFNVLTSFILNSSYFGLGILMGFGPFEFFVISSLGIFLGCLLCQYTAVWIWMQLFISNWRARIYLGGLLIAAITLSGTLQYQLNFFSGSGAISAPWYNVTVLSLMLVIVATVFYWFQGWFLGLFLKRTHLTVELQLQIPNEYSNQYTILRIFGVMLVVGIASLLLKYLAVIGSNLNVRSIAMSVLWIFCSAFWTALIVYLQFASRFALVPQKFRWRWWLAVIIAPLLYPLSFVLLSKAIDPTFPTSEIFAAIPFIYVMEFGFVIATRIQLWLIPREAIKQVYAPIFSSPLPRSKQ
jgi:hypothetical protein